MNNYIRAILLAVAPVLALAQTAQITGRLADPSDAVVPGGLVKVRNTETGILRDTTVNESGYYTVAQLPKGSYQVTVSKQGFRTITRSGVELDEGQILRLDFRLEVGQVSEAIEVHGETTLLDTSTASMSTVVTNQKIEDLPMSGRNPVALAQLVPGVRMLGSMGALPTSSWSAGAAAIGGGSPGSNAYMIDGASNDFVNGGGMMTFLSVDATEETRIITRNPSAEYGRTGGGVMTLVSKSGTNQFHGSAYEFLRNRSLNANSFFSNKTGTPRAALVFNEYGVTTGGPIVRNRTFFFFNWEQFKNHTQATAIRTVPTAQQLTGDFSSTFTSSGALIKIYDPLTTSGSSATGFTRTAFAGNIIPVSRLSAAGVAMAKYYPAPNTQGAANTNANNFSGQAAAPQDKNILGIKIDHNFTQNRRLSGRYSYDHLAWDFGNLYGNIAEPSNSPMPIWRNSMNLSYTDVVRPDLLFEARLGVNRYFTNRPTRSYGLDLSTIGLPSALNSQVRTRQFPNLSVTDMSAIGAIGADQLRQATEGWTASAAVTKFKGAHTIKVGFEQRLYRFNSDQDKGALAFGFTRAFTQGPDPTQVSSTSGYGLATMLLGDATSGSADRWTPSTNQYSYTAAYIQDDWKVTPALTLNLGLRWDFEGSMTDRYNALTNFDTTVQTTANGVALRGGAVFPGVNGVSRGLYDSSYQRGGKDFGPRVGFAWQALPKTSFRGGFGLFYIPFSYNAPSTGFDIVTNMVTSQDSVTPYNTLANPFPSGLSSPSGSSLGTLTALGTSLNAAVRNQAGPYSEQWNFSVQRELPANWLVELGYSGNHGVKLQSSRSYSYLTAAQRALGSDMLTLVANPYYGLITSGTLSAKTVQRRYLVTQYPQFTGAFGYDSWGNSNYHAATVRVEKRFSHGYAVLISYAWSKLIDDNTGGVVPASGGGSDGIQDWDNLRWARAISTSNLPHRLVLNPSWRLPTVTTGPRPLRLLANNWQINNIVTLQSGNPFSVTASAPTGGGGWPNVVGDPNDVSQSINKWFNTSAFTTISPWTMGTAPRNLPRTRTDSLFNWDFSAIRYIPVTERVKIELRAEFFNLTNSVTFGTPGTSVGSSTFGIISSQANTPRVIQFGLKLKY